jgi:glycosyltransferase involved in cell wall biosynthesis
MRAPGIVIDARMAMDGGIGTYLQQLVPRIAKRRPLWRLTALGSEPRMRALGWGEIANLRLVQSAAPIFSIREQIELPVRVNGADLYWAPNYDVPVLSRTPLVVTIHDVNHIALPELLGGSVRRAYARWMLSTAVSRARRVLYDSEFTRQEAVRLLGNGSTKGRVVHLGVDESWRRARELAPERPIAEPYFLYVGNIKRHKNVPFLLRAFGRAMDRVPHRLLLVGRTEGLRADPEVSAALAPLGRRASLLGELPASEVRRYVAHAHAVVTASLYEGFGLPALEAMAAGAPCLVSRAGSLPEICGDAALFGDPRDEAEFAGRLVQVATDEPLRASLIARGRDRAAMFRWDQSADDTIAVLHEAMLGA